MRCPDFDFCVISKSDENKNQMRGNLRDCGKTGNELNFWLMRLTDAPIEPPSNEKKGWFSMTTELPRLSAEQRQAVFFQELTPERRQHVFKEELSKVAIGLIQIVTNTNNTNVSDSDPSLEESTSEWMTKAEVCLTIRKALCQLNPDNKRPSERLLDNWKSKQPDLFVAKTREDWMNSDRNLYVDPPPVGSHGATLFYLRTAIDRVLRAIAEGTFEELVK